MAILRKSILAATFLTFLAAPLHAQMYSDGFEFLEAVRERDGTAATQALNEPGSTIVNARDIGTGESALHIVTQRRDLAWIRFLTSKGANPNIRDKNGVAPLVIASSLGFVDGAEALLAAGARVDETNVAGETPLISAVHRRDLGMVRLLLANGASPDRADNSGRSARDYAELMASNSLLSEFEKADAQRAGQGIDQTYGPSF